MQSKIIEIKSKSIKEISEAKTKERTFESEKKYLGRNSEFNQILKNIKNLSEEEKKEIGKMANLAKKEIEENLKNSERIISESNFDFQGEKIDITIPGKRKKTGHLNILSQVRNEIEDIFTGMGFEVADGPEVETEHYNFDALNIPKDHPARDEWDTFWMKPEEKSEHMLLRTHTSPVQIRYMEKNEPPFRIISPGKCFRREATDSTHEHTFYQFEALVVGEDVNVANFKYIGEQFFSKFFKKDGIVHLNRAAGFGISCYAAFGNGLLKQPLCGGRCQHVVYARAPGRFARNGHIIGVTAKCGNVVAHPAQGGNLV